MKSFVLDCSVSATWCFGDEKNSYVDSVLESFAEGYQALVPQIWILETMNVLALAERRRLLAEAETVHFFELYSSLPIRIATGLDSVLECRPLLSLAREHSLSSYDAAYLEMAKRNGIPLATQDSALRAACEKSGIPVFKLS
jgi:predicted nucleic acid-binding protein